MNHWRHIVVWAWRPGAAFEIPPGRSCCRSLPALSQTFHPCGLWSLCFRSRNPGLSSYLTWPFLRPIVLRGLVLFDHLSYQQKRTNWVSFTWIPASWLTKKGVLLVVASRFACLHSSVVPFGRRCAGSGGRYLGRSSGASASSGLFGLCSFHSSIRQGPRKALWKACH